MKSDAPIHSIRKITDTLQYSRTYTVTSLAKEEVVVKRDVSTASPSESLPRFWRLVVALLRALGVNSPWLKELVTKGRRDSVTCPKDAEEEIEG